MAAENGSERRRWSLRAPLPDALQPGSELRRWVALSVRSAITIVDIGLLVVGTGLVGIGLAFMLSGLGLIELGVAAELGTLLAVGLVTAMLGGFAIGVAVEGPISYTAPRSTTKPWEPLVASIPALLLFVWTLGILERVADRLLIPLSELFGFVANHLAAVQQAGVTTALIGLPVMWAMRQFLASRFVFFVGAAPGALYIAWMIGVVAVYNPLL